jgi:hypothetical protein
MTRIRNIVVIAALALLAVPATSMASTRLIAGAPGTFQLQIVKANAATQQAKLVRNGPC